MKKLLCAITFILTSSIGAHAQAPFRITTSPKLPMRDALERMNLVTAWNTRVTVNGNRDGVYSVQVLPGPTNQLVVQTHRGMVYLFDADQGDLLWKTQVGVPFWTPQPAGYNSQSIFVMRRSMLHVLNRSTGAQRVYTVDRHSKLVDFGYQLAYTPNAAPVADEEFLYLSLGDRTGALFIPNFDRIARLKREEELFRKGGKGPPLLPNGEPAVANLDSPQPEFYWSYRFAQDITMSSPLFFGDQVSFLTTDGTLTSVGRYEQGPRQEHFEFKMTGKTAGAPGQHLNMAYVGSDDFNLYAINMSNGRLAWRYISGAPILRAPRVNDRDLFIAPDHIGLRRLDRVSGREIWTNRDASRFLAVNHVNVYARDHRGKFFVLDGRRGSTLASLDLSDWAISVANEWTDRIYLAANDGQILCLRHRDLLKPLALKAPEAPRPPPKKKPMEEKKDVEEKAFGPGRGPAWQSGASTISAAFDKRLVWARR